VISTPATTRQRLVVQSSDPKIAACIMLAFKQGGVPLACKMVPSTYRCMTWWTRSGPMYCCGPLVACGCA
jgi:hypothetical protein